MSLETIITEDDLRWYCSWCNKKVKVDVKSARTIGGSWELEYTCSGCGHVFTVQYDAE